MMAWYPVSSERRRFQKGDRLDLDNPVDMPEEQVVEDATDEEIFEAVQQMQSDRETWKLMAVTRCQQVPKPTRKEVLQAVAILRRYLEDEEGQSARKLEGGLAALDGKCAWNAQEILFQLQLLITSS
jgi:hypothetical protein